jgi:hypothetical protein
MTAWRAQCRVNGLRHANAKILKGGRTFRRRDHPGGVDNCESGLRKKVR